MEFLTDLWLPILVSAVFVFIASSVLHMAIPIHKGDHAPLPGEAAVLEEMRKHGVRPNDYSFPYCASMKELGSKEMLAKFEQGPVGFLTVLPSGPPAMGKSLLQWFLYSILISIFAAYLASVALGDAPNEAAIFRFTGTVAVLGYGVTSIPNSIWKGLRWSTTSKFIFDGIVYGLVTAATFAWLW